MCCLLNQRKRQHASKIHISCVCATLAMYLLAFFTLFLVMLSYKKPFFATHLFESCLTLYVTLCLFNFQYVYLFLAVVILTLFNTGSLDLDQVCR